MDATCAVLDNSLASGFSYSTTSSSRHPASSKPRICWRLSTIAARSARHWWSANYRLKPGIRHWPVVTPRWRMPSWIASFNTRTACHLLARRCADANHHPRRTPPLRNDSPPADHQRVCAACGRHFPARGRKAYCSDACRQRGFRLRRRPADELQFGFAHRLPKTAIVYQCPACDARLLGQQRCEDCGVFGRRLGPGGLLPPLR